MSSPQETVFYGQHRQLGARMGEFAGWSMPIRYPTGIIAEHLHTRCAASLFDTCHMGEFRVSGGQAAAQLDGLLARRVSDQCVGTCRYNFLVNAGGGVLDDLLVYRLAEREFYLVVNAGRIGADAEWIASHLHGDATFCDESSWTAKLDLQGPATARVLADLGVDTCALPGYYRWRTLDLVGVPVLVSRTGYTGESGVELYLTSSDAAALWQGLLDHVNVSPAGLGARDTLRLEMGFPLYGAELGPDVTPVEAGFGRLVRADLQQTLSERACKALVGFRLSGRRAARAGHRVWSSAGGEAGVITSGSYAPSLGYAVALGYMDGRESVPPGTEVCIGPKREPAQAVPLPFYPRGTARASW